MNAGRVSFWADLQATTVTTADTVGKLCRMAVSDISARKQAEEAQRRIVFLAATNRKLDQEIVPTSRHGSRPEGERDACPPIGGRIASHAEETSAP